MSCSPLLHVKDLVVEFSGENHCLRAVDGLSFSLNNGQMSALVGESGSGKSVTALSILQLLPALGRITQGQIWFKGRNLLEVDRHELRDLRGNQMALVFQEPQSALNPVLTVGEQVAEVLRRHLGHSKQKARVRSLELLSMVGLPEPEICFRCYPHQFSGGMRQRIVLAMALSCSPDLLIADEPTSALDPILATQISQLLLEAHRRSQMAVLLITHDLRLVLKLCEQLVVMYRGQWMERGQVKECFAAPAHPYTAMLLRSAEKLSGKDVHVTDRGETFSEGSSRGQGCPYAWRCESALSTCYENRPPPRLVEDGSGASTESEREVRCFNPLVRTRSPERKS